MTPSEKLVIKETQLLNANTALTNILSSEMSSSEIENGIAGSRIKSTNLRIKELKDLIDELEKEIIDINKQINGISRNVASIRVRR
jgi:hypothetical protein